jgi:hypothetical protein
MQDAAAQLFDGIDLKLRDGTVVPCKSPSVRHARLLMRAYNRLLASVPPTPNGHGADAQATAAAQATYEAAVVADEAGRRSAMTELLDVFPAAVAATEVAQEALIDGLSLGDIMGVLPTFFWKRTGAAVVGQEAPTSAQPTGTTLPVTGSPPSASPSTPT